MTIFISVSLISNFENLDLFALKIALYYHGHLLGAPHDRIGSSNMKIATFFFVPGLIGIDLSAEKLTITPPSELEPKISPVIGGDIPLI
ncbi:hypothetical protein JOD82_003461 [Paenibacillus sp. 1182]|uniref:hypothetical protein n=1 Tax=Paenibacillus sp. 1182 TaxID=2806565 RepID=UPI001AE314C7|nr:hypothetical protein [Paenibacillus sp. 1182]MBP1310364.1 hypothetical protein [Paenibacillus sp. 1182]